MIAMRALRTTKEREEKVRGDVCFGSFFSLGSRRWWWCCLLDLMKSDMLLQINKSKEKE